MPAQDGPPPQVIDLVVVGGAGVGEHAVGRVLDADDAAGEDGGGLGEREQIALLGPLAGAPLRRTLQRRPGQRVHLFPARFTAYGQQRDARLDGGRTERRGLPGSVQLDRHGSGPVASAGPQRGERRAAPCAYGEDQLAGVGHRRVLGVEQRDAADLDVQPVGRGLQLHQGLAQRHQQLAQADARTGWRCHGSWIHDRRLCRVRLAGARRAAGPLAGLPIM
ncbi:hypothetical protein RB199_00675 [Streptomyces libani]